MIRLEKINKTYFGAQPLHVLKGIDLEVAEGELGEIDFAQYLGHPR